MKELFLLLLLILNIQLYKFQNYCDIYNNCDNCLYCGFNNDNKCTCSLNNGYCFDEYSNQLIYYRDFLLNYDGCYSNEGELLNICGESFFYINNGENHIINLKSTSISNFVCNYRIMKAVYNPNTNLKIRISRNGNLSPEFNLFLIVYDNNYNIKTETSSNVLITDSYLEIDEYNCQNISMYLEFKNSQYIEELSLTFFHGYSELIDSTDSMEVTERTPTSQNPPLNNSKTGLLIGIIIGGIAIVIEIIIIIILIYKKINKKKKEIIGIPDINYSLKDLKEMVEKKEKADKLLKELKKNVYNKKIIRDSKCALCNENFIDTSIVITIECKHTFHEKCFNNFIKRDFNCRRCPICNYLILGSDNKIVTENIPEQIKEINQGDSKIAMKVEN